MLYIYIFDLDNTLIYTDLLNNNSYNYALIQQGLEPIDNYTRITRDIVFINYPHLNNEQKSKIIRLKQEFFINNIHNTQPNTPLFAILQSQDTEHCVLWTKADKIRVETLLAYYKINNSFKKILYSDKVNISQDVEKICELYKCKPEQLVFYEDNQYVIRKLQQLGLNAVPV